MTPEEQQGLEDRLIAGAMLQAENAAVDRFKSALREEIEKMIEKEPTDNDRIYPNEKAAIEAYEKVLEKLEALQLFITARAASF